MATPDLTEDERAELVRVVRAAIDGDRFVLSPRVKGLKSVLAKARPDHGEVASRASSAATAERRAESVVSEAAGRPAETVADRTAVRNWS